MLLCKKSAQAFLDLIDPTEKRWCFAFFHDPKQKKPRQPLFGTLDEHWAAIVKSQEQGYAFYFVPNKIYETSNSRTKADIEKIRVVTVDFDQKDKIVSLDDIKAIAPAPHIIVESSAGNYHAYWKVDGFTQVQAEQINRNMAYALGGDRGVHTSEHVFRMAGSLHQKREPFLTRLVHSADHDAWAFDAFKAFEKFHDPKSKAQEDYTPVRCDDPDTLIDLFVNKFPHREQWWAAKRKSYNADGPDRSRYDYYLAGLVREDGLPIEAFDALVKLWHGKHSMKGDGKAHRPDYVARTWARHHDEIRVVYPGGDEDAEERKARREEILTLLGLTVDEEGHEEARIQVRAHAVAAVARQAADAVSASEPNLYRRSKELVRLVHDRRVGEDIEWAPNNMFVEPVSLPYLKKIMEVSATWLRYSKANNGWKPGKVCEDAAKLLMADISEWPDLNHLKTISRSPLMTPDGRLISRPGYDRHSGVVYEPANGAELPPIGKTKKAAREALDRLKDVFKDFPFVDDASRSVVLAACLTPFVRPFLPSAPMFLFNAPQPGTGKSLIAKLCGIIAVGDSPNCVSQPEDNDSMQKLIGALLLAGSPMTLIDNIDRPLKGDMLNAVMTSSTASVRRLGATEMLTLPTTMTWLGTGNNIRTKGDFHRRVLMATIDADMPCPEDRAFDYDIVEKVQESRYQLVADCLTILHAFHYTQAKVKIPVFGSFETWSDAVRKPLVWLGEADPLITKKEVKKVQEREENSHRFFELWWEVHGNGYLRSKELFQLSKNKREKPTVVKEDMKKDRITDATEKENLPSTLREMADLMAAETQQGRWRRVGDLNVVKIGHYLGKYTNTFVGNYKLTREKGNYNISLWRLEKR